MPPLKYNTQNCVCLGDTNFRLIPGYKENAARMLMLFCQRQVGMVQGSINWCDSFRPTAEFKRVWCKECQRKFSNETLVSDFFLIFFFLICMLQTRAYQYSKKWSFHIYYFGETEPQDNIDFFFIFQASCEYSLILYIALTCKHFLNF